MNQPRLAEVQCTRIKFEEGDQLVVRLYQPLSRAEVEKLKNTVQEWAGAHVKILLVYMHVFNVQIVPRTHDVLTIPKNQEGLVVNG